MITIDHIEIYMEWKKGLEDYSKTGDQKVLVSYRTLAEKHGVSHVFIQKICKTGIEKTKNNA